VPRPRTYNDEARTQAITVRVTKNTHGRLTADAARAGMSVAGLAERYISKGSVRISGSHNPLLLCPVTVAELKRIGQALNDIAETGRATGAFDANHVTGTLRDLIHAMLHDEILRRKAQALAPRIEPHDSAPPSPRDEFQRVV
jgi:hypothetical protein